jgi:hypothetical protein
MKQTAVSWLENELSKYDIHKPISLSNWDTLKQLLEKAKQIEKENTIMAFKDGRWSGPFVNATAEEYYQQTYNK